MPNKLQIALILAALFLSGCGGRPTLVESSIEKCPPEKPVLVNPDCPASFPEKGEHLDTLLKAWEDAALYSFCRDELIKLWERGWDDCP